MELSRQGRIDVTGGRVWYGIAGADSPGTPLLTLHGGPGSTHDYLEPLWELASDRPVIFYDQLGGGNSDRPEDTTLWTAERFVGELEQVRAALGLEKIHLLGHSWGTMLAVLYLLSKKREGVKSLTLASPYLSTPMWTTDQRSYIEELPSSFREAIVKGEAAGEFGSEQYQKAMFHFYRLHLCRIDPWPEPLARSFSKTNLDIYYRMWGPSEFTMTGNLKEMDVTGDLSKLDLPVLYICGEFDEATPSSVKLFQSRTPRSEMAVIAGASHMPQLEQPKEFLNILGNFLRD